MAPTRHGMSARNTISVAPQRIAGSRNTRHGTRDTGYGIRDTAVLIEINGDRPAAVSRLARVLYLRVGGMITSRWVKVKHLGSYGIACMYEAERLSAISIRCRPYLQAGCWVNRLANIRASSTFRKGGCASAGCAACVAGNDFNDDNTKELIIALVTNKIEAEKSTDLMAGKGNGLIILLHGYVDIAYS